MYFDRRIPSRPLYDVIGAALNENQYASIATSMPGSRGEPPEPHTTVARVVVGSDLRTVRWFDERTSLVGGDIKRPPRNRRPVAARVAGSLAVFRTLDGDEAKVGFTAGATLVLPGRHRDAMLEEWRRDGTCSPVELESLAGHDLFAGVVTSWRLTLPMEPSVILYGTSMECTLPPGAEEHLQPVRHLHYALPGAVVQRQP